MSHGIEENDTMFSVKENPWHGLGTVIDEAPSLEEGIKLAGLDWEVECTPVQVVIGPSGQPMQALPEKTGEVPHGAQLVNLGHFAQAVRRKDTGDILGTVGPSWHPLQNVKAFEFFGKFVSGGLAKLETAGSLFNGRRVWVLATPTKDNIVEVGDGDRVGQHILLSNSHDGRTSVRVGFTPIRVVCNNTLTMAHNNQGSRLLRIRHTCNVEEAVATASTIIDVARQQFYATADQWRRMTKIGFNEEDMTKYVIAILGRGNNAGKKLIPTLWNLFRDGVGSQLKTARDTLWGAYNAITEWATHHRGNGSAGSAAKRLDQVHWGASQKTIQEALSVAIQICDERESSNIISIPARTAIEVEAIEIKE